MAAGASTSTFFEVSRFWPIVTGHSRPRDGFFVEVDKVA
ncbi:hypothetical protein N825_22780 [Skermanella stibiiresistens SB22]|uniref:Uncharacterized protein n=1 Tax=Skermanella stibiiresistens SB22 TaxID=1385369 RepID=W9GSS0_9PROT|nr:hypothetical protein N825_22780 [Skermanella stibiiresistens SB22]